MTLVQSYFLDNFILLALVGGLIIAVTLESGVGYTTKRNLFIVSILIAISSVSNFIMVHWANNAFTEDVVLGSAMTYYILRPFIIAIILETVMNRKQLVSLIWIPAIINAFVYLGGAITESSIYYDDMRTLSFGSSAICVIVIDWIYWGILMSFESWRYDEKQNKGYISRFLYLMFLMTAEILEACDIIHGVFNMALVIGCIFYYMFVHIEISKKVVEEKDMILKEQRVSLMISQIQPHFVYNTLNTITALCRTNPKLAEHTTINFSKYLRENMLNMGKSERHSFEEELEHTKIYLEIEKLRFGDRINVEYNINEKNFMIPSLSLQPIVENAVKHGICKKTEGGTVKISTYKWGREYIIKVEDDGVGFEVSNYENDGRSHIGIKNVRERLRDLEGAELEITSYRGIGTTVTIIIPEKRRKIEEKRDRREIHSFGR